MSENRSAQVLLAFHCNKGSRCEEVRLDWLDSTDTHAGNLALEGTTTKLSRLLQSPVSQDLHLRFYLGAAPSTGLA